MDDVRFYLDPTTGQPHIYEHGVDETEVLEVLSSPVEDGPGRDDAFVAIGRTWRGRILKIIYVIDDDRDGIFVVTAYALTGKPLAAFRRRERKRNR